MPRRLTDAEWLVLSREVDLDNLDFPPWGGIVQWEGMRILAHRNNQGGWDLTDISDQPDLFADYPTTYDSWSKVFIQTFPSAVMDRVIELYQTAGSYVPSPPALGFSLYTLAVIGLVAFIFLRAPRGA